MKSRLFAGAKFSFPLFFALHRQVNGKAENSASGSAIRGNQANGRFIYGFPIRMVKARVFVVIEKQGYHKKRRCTAMLVTD